ncbi:MAG TPA: DsbA family protein [Acidimicrobiia bacterium]|nr:DsbA family protein [Acidimicrobiia bacterium]
MARSVAVTFDYRCPFAYNGNLAAINAIRGGTDIEFRFVPFSLDQVHVSEGEPAMWERDPADWGSGMRALLYGIAVRDTFGDAFFDAHIELFAARHEHGKQLGEEDVLKEAVAAAGLDADKVAEEAWSGRPLKTLQAEHTECVDQHGVFGVPTFWEDGQAAFVRFMSRGDVDDLARMLEFLTWSELNEFKRPRIPR